MSDMQAFQARSMALSKSSAPTDKWDTHAGPTRREDMEAKYATAVGSATEIYDGSRKRVGKNEACVWAKTCDGGIRLTASPAAMDTMGMEPRDRVSLVKLPNGNYVLARNREGVMLVKGPQSRQCAVIMRGLQMGADRLEAQFDQHGLAYFAPGSFEAQTN